MNLRGLFPRYAMEYMVYDKYSEVLKDPKIKSLIDQKTLQNIHQKTLQKAYVRRYLRSFSRLKFTRQILLNG